MLAVKLTVVTLTLGSGCSRSLAVVDLTVVTLLAVVAVAPRQWCVRLCFPPGDAQLWNNRSVALQLVSMGFSFPTLCCGFRMLVCKASGMPIPWSWLHLEVQHCHPTYQWGGRLQRARIMALHKIVGIGHLQRLVVRHLFTQVPATLMSFPCSACLLYVLQWFRRTAVVARLTILEWIQL